MKTFLVPTGTMFAKTNNPDFPQEKKSVTIATKVKNKKDKSLKWAFRNYKKAPCVSIN